jgi:hypothetical protein
MRDSVHTSVLFFVRRDKEKNEKKTLAPPMTGRLTHTGFTRAAYGYAMLHRSKGFDAHSPLRRRAFRSFHSPKSLLLHPSVQAFKRQDLSFCNGIF